MSAPAPIAPEPLALSESPEFVAALSADAISIYRPANSHEHFAVERIVAAQLSMRRAAALEARLFSNLEAELNTTALNSVLRYQAQAERLYRRALADLERLQTARAERPEELPVEPPSAPNPSKPGRVDPDPPPFQNNPVPLTPSTVRDAIHAVRTGL